MMNTSRASLRRGSSHVILFFKKEKYLKDNLEERYMIEPDPNWFYSALAQSSAAIFGLIGAFMMSKIIEQAKEVRTLRSELEDLIRDLYRILDEASVSMFELRRNLLSIGYELQESTEAPGGEGNLKSVINEAIGIRIDLKEGQIKNLLEEFEKEILKLEEIMIWISGLDIDFDNERFREKILSANFEEDFEMRWQINPLLSQVVDTKLVLFTYFRPFKKFKEAFINTLGKFMLMKSTIIPIRFYLGVLILIPIGTICLICPLWMMPYPQEKLLLMGPFSAFILFLCGYFAYEIIYIRKIGTMKSAEMQREEIMDIGYKIHVKKMLSELRTKIRHVLIILMDLQDKDKTSLLKETNKLPTREYWEEAQYYISMYPWVLEGIFEFVQLVEEIRHPPQHETAEEAAEKTHEKIREAMDDAEYLIKRLPISSTEIVRVGLRKKILVLYGE